MGIRRVTEYGEQANCSTGPVAASPARSTAPPTHEAASWYQPLRAHGAEDRAPLSRDAPSANHSSSSSRCSPRTGDSEPNSSARTQRAPWGRRSAAPPWFSCTRT
ncbi:hypothetical protein ACIPYS_39505 [Kitasatospora sp. NPDC089913]|uniref:hypothetical protein n=1 Tax=Kitasatospora sp. NPDC089913 TaxID=3364080 RepID=UPI003824B0EE